MCLAEDHDAVRDALRELLTAGLGVEHVVEAKCGEDALAAVRAGAVDLVLMDVNMPGLDGVAATRRIREQHPAVRVVALTAAHDPDSIAAMIAAGADSYLVKSASPLELRESLADILGGRAVLAPEALPVVLAGLARRLRDEEERAAELVALDRTKREFISLVSDQLRNPLTVISGYTKTLRTGWPRIDDDTKQQFLERMDNQAEKLERRIEQLLTVAGLEAGAERPSSARFALDGVVREVMDRCAEAGGERVIETRLEPVDVLADRRAVSAVVLALVDNALVHGVGTVVVEVRRIGQEAVVEVADEGPGVPPAVLAVILEEPFMPGDAADTRPSSGMGLSLYIARRVLENVGGRIELDSAVGRGTVARARLRAAPGA